MRDFPITMPDGEQITFQLDEEEAGLRVLRWPGQPRFEMIVAPTERDEEIAAEATAFIPEVDRRNPAQFLR